MIYCIPQGNYGNQIYCYNNTIKYCMINNIDLNDICIVHSRFFKNHKLKSFQLNNEQSFKQSTYNFKHIELDENLYNNTILKDYILITKYVKNDWIYNYSKRFKYNIKEINLDRNESILTLQKYNNICFCKCFANWKFENIGKNIDILINKELKKDLLNKYSFIQDNNLYILNIRTEEYQTKIYEIDLIFKYILNINKNAKFYISSNDIDWCKNNIKSNLNKIEFHNNINAYSDALLFSCGKNVICTYGTFSEAIKHLSKNKINYYTLQNIKESFK